MAGEDASDVAGTGGECGDAGGGLRSPVAGDRAAWVVAAVATFVVVAVLSIGFGTSGGLTDRWLHRDLVPVGVIAVFAVELAVATAGVWVARRAGGAVGWVAAGAVLPPLLVTVVFLLLP